MALEMNALDHTTTNLMTDGAGLIVFAGWHDILDANIVGKILASATAVYKFKV